MWNGTGQCYAGSSFKKIEIARFKQDTTLAAIWLTRQARNMSQPVFAVCATWMTLGVGSGWNPIAVHSWEEIVLPITHFLGGSLLKDAFRSFLFLVLCVCRCGNEREWTNQSITLRKSRTPEQDEVFNPSTSLLPYYLIRVVIIGGIKGG